MKSMSSFRNGILLGMVVTLFPTAPECSETLHEEIEALISEPEFEHAHWGILVLDLDTAETVYELNAEKLFAPASTTKLFSVATALDALGADFRFQTPVYRRGELDSDGILQGDLILVASGDLSLGGRTDEKGRISFTNHDHTYANFGDNAELTGEDPLAGLNDLANQIKTAGIEHVKGEVVVDDRLFEKTTGTGSGPTRLTPIMVNDNLIDLLITPGTVGEPATVTWRPRTTVFGVDSRVVTVDEGKDTLTWIKDTGSGTVRIDGQIPVDHKPLVRIYEVPNAAAFGRSLFIESLRRAGIKVDAASNSSNPRNILPESRSAYKKMPRVACLVSPPFSESVRLILKVSHNSNASTLPLLVASRKGKRTLEDGLRMQHDFLARAGVDVDSISFAGAAGGARADYVTPRATVQLLRHMATRSDFDAFKSALPELGVDGTLVDIVGSDSEVRGKVQAKTGTLLWKNVMNDRFLLTSKALAGYMTDARGRRLAFAAFVNHVHLAKPEKTAVIGRKLGRLCEIVYSAR